MACHCCGGSILSKIYPSNNLWQLLCMKIVVSCWKCTFFFTLCIRDYSCRDGEELDSQGDASSQPDTISIASRTSQNTMDSDKVRNHSLFSIQTATRATAVSLARSPHPYVISPSSAGHHQIERTLQTVRTVQKSTRLCERESSLAVIGPS